MPNKKQQGKVEKIVSEKDVETRTLQGEGILKRGDGDYYIDGDIFPLGGFDVHSLGEQARKAGYNVGDIVPYQVEITMPKKHNY